MSNFYIESTQRMLQEVEAGFTASLKEFAPLLIPVEYLEILDPKVRSSIKITLHSNGMINPQWVDTHLLLAPVSTGELETCVLNLRILFDAIKLHRFITVGDPASYAAYAMLLLEQYTDPDERIMALERDILDGTFRKSFLGVITPAEGLQELLADKGFASDEVKVIANRYVFHFDC